MKNHYDICLEEIAAYIQNGDKDQALAIIQEELAMPYIPLTYQNQFETFRDQLIPNKKPHSQFYDDAQDIQEALLGNDALKQKALMSLERMNLRFELALVEQVLQEPMVEDWIKKNILLMLMQQEIKGTFKVCFKNSVLMCNIEELVNPIGTEAYMKCRQMLIDRFESSNPSFMYLCIEMLDMQSLNQFPFEVAEFDGDAIVALVEKALG